MGKIRVKTLGDNQLEQEQKNKAKKRQEAKKTAKAPGLKGGERVVAVGPTEEELARLDEQTRQAKIDQEANQPKTGQEDKKAQPSKEKDKKAKKSAGKARERSKKYRAVAQLVERTKTYPLTDALETLPKIKLSSFDETVELHITAIETGITGTVTLPHGTGKQRRIAIVDPTTASGQVQFDQLLKEIDAGKIQFDILIATPAAMPKLARVAKILGPRGLMPNPKNGTITTNPSETIKKFQGGLLNYKTESKSPIIHLSVGKLSFGTKKLEENIQTVLLSLPQNKVKKVTLKSTMSPGLKINFLTI